MSGLQGVKCFDYSRELDVIATGSADHRVRLWDPYVPSRPMAVLVGHDTMVIDVAVHSNLKVLFSFSHDRVRMGSGRGWGQGELVIHKNVL